MPFKYITRHDNLVTLPEFYLLVGGSAPNDLKAPHLPPCSSSLRSKMLERFFYEITLSCTKTGKYAKKREEKIY